MKHRGVCYETQRHRGHGVYLENSLCALCVSVFPYYSLSQSHPSSYLFPIRKVRLSYKTDRIAVDHDDRFVLQDVAVLLRCDDLTGLREP